MIKLLCESYERTYILFNLIDLKRYFSFFCLGKLLPTVIYFKVTKKNTVIHEPIHKKSKEADRIETTEDHEDWKVVVAPLFYNKH